MRLAIGETRDLVLDRRAVARSWPGDRPCVQRRMMQIVEDNPVRSRRRARDAAGDLPIFDLRRQIGERLWRRIAPLPFQPVPADGAAVEPRRRASFQPRDSKAGRAQPPAQRVRRRVAHPAGRRPLVADVDDAAKERPGGDDDSRRPNFALGGDDAANRDVFHQQIVDAAFDDRQIFGLGQRRLDRRAVEPAVGLGARTTHRRPLGAIEHPELNAGGVGDAPHQTVEGVDLPNQLPLAKAPDRRVARHFSDFRAVLGDQRRYARRGAPRRRQPRSRRARRRSQSRRNVSWGSLFHVKHITCRYKSRKNRVEHVIDIDGADDPPERASGAA